MYYIVRVGRVKSRFTQIMSEMISKGYIKRIKKGEYLTPEKHFAKKIEEFAKKFEDITDKRKKGRFFVEIEEVTDEVGLKLEKTIEINGSNNNNNNNAIKPEVQKELKELVDIIGRLNKGMDFFQTIFLKIIQNYDDYEKSEIFHEIRAMLMKIMENKWVLDETDKEFVDSVRAQLSS